MRIPGTIVHDTLHGTMFDDQIYGYGGDDTLYGEQGNDWLWGGGDNDTLYGGVGDDYLWGEGGTDTLFGEGDNDHLYGGDGRDSLHGMDGTDWLCGGDDPDLLDGGGGFDTAAYGDSDAAVLVSLVAGRGFSGDAEGDTLYQIENLSGSWYGDWLIGDDNGNVLSGLGGDDTLWGYGGSDHLNGDEGADTLNGGGNITRYVLTGGPGADKFVFSSIDDIGNAGPVHSFPGLVDLITDFSRAEGDQINLHAIDADDRPEAPGNQDFSTYLVPEGVAFTTPGQISWLHDGGETWITLNTDLDSLAEATIRMTGSYTPDASWFVF